MFSVAHLSDLRRQIGGLDDALLLAALGLGPVGEMARNGGKPRGAEVPASGTRRAPEVATKAKRLSDLTGIPRETVRRKLQAFHRRGWVEQRDDRTWRPSPDANEGVKVASDLAGANVLFLTRLARLVADVARLQAPYPRRTLERPVRAPGSPPVTGCARPRR